MRDNLVNELVSWLAWWTHVALVFVPVYFAVYGVLHVLALAMGWRVALVAGVPADAVMALALLVPASMHLDRIRRA